MGNSKYRSIFFKKERESKPQEEAKRTASRATIASAIAASCMRIILVAAWRMLPSESLTTTPAIAEPGLIATTKFALMLSGWGEDQREGWTVACQAEIWDSKVAEIYLMELEGWRMIAFCTTLFLENYIWSIVTAAKLETFKLLFLGMASTLFGLIIAKIHELKGWLQNRFEFRGKWNNSIKYEQKHTQEKCGINSKKDLCKKDTPTLHHHPNKQTYQYLL
jgi:hypothetical protein